MEHHNSQKIAVLFGGNSNERSVSLKSGRNIARSLKSIGIQVDLIDTKRDFDMKKIASMKYKKIFIALHGRDGEDGTIQKQLERANIAYTGNGVFSSSISMNKILSKKIWNSSNLPIAPFLYISKKFFFTESETITSSLIKKIRFPMIIKPNSEGSSIGINVVRSSKEIEKSMMKAFEYDHYVMIEKYLSGSEYTISILNPSHMLPSIKIHLHEDELYSHHKKYFDKDTRYLCPSGLSESKEHLMNKIALTAYRSIGCTGLARVDIRQNQNGDFCLLEINTVPGMTNRSLVKISAEQGGMSFVELIKTVLAQDA
ncbi:D-alanine--D-alanine ligase [Candidatus Riesia pediculischaeffi]|uniref:D-alanine--D-alanine ligase n=2 Tax=Candidatus Riesia pediculischaeffi TaxID=428411 RepID=A0A1V0HKE1_9ENTR|nr:D-alanine--D-alanine ligase [Candidatus Riesia pediculischaeffi]ARC53191.1 hypothetical protein AOQ87_00540 [Candidatus Riesia pediculischaeffi]KIE64174.1 D-alanine--D-alanine ligase [Candidatus Riesia pediculischaeffi PTSU]